RFNVPLYWNRTLRRSPTINIMRLCSRFNGQVSSIRQDPKNFFSGFPMQQPHETISSRRTPDSLDTMRLLTPSRDGGHIYAGIRGPDVPFPGEGRGSRCPVLTTP